jgi:hypothetical protein
LNDRQSLGADPRHFGACEVRRLRLVVDDFPWRRVADLSVGDLLVGDELR